MGILFAGGEYNDFPIGAGYVYEYTWQTPYRSGYARGAMGLYGGWFIRMSEPFEAGPVTTAWLTGQICQFWTPKTNKSIIGLCNSSEAHGSGIWVTTGNSSAWKIRLIKYDGTTVTQLGESASNILSDRVVKKIDLEVSNYGANATVNVYAEGNPTPIITYNGDVRTGTMINMDCVGLMGYIDAASDTLVASEIIACTSDTKSFSLVTLVPTGAGDANAWNGLYSDMNTFYPSGTKSIYVNSNGQAAQFAMSDLPAGDPYIWGIKIVARASAPYGSTPGKIKLGVKSGGSIDLDAGQAVGESYQNIERWATKINGANLTPALVNAIQIAFESAA